MRNKSRMTGIWLLIISILPFGFAVFMFQKLEEGDSYWTFWLSAALAIVFIAVGVFNLVKSAKKKEMAAGSDEPSKSDTDKNEEN